MSDDAVVTEEWAPAMNVPTTTVDRPIPTSVRQPEGGGGAPPDELDDRRRPVLPSIRVPTEAVTTS